MVKTEEQLMDEAVEESADKANWLETSDGSFEGEVWLSTDGKNTVRVQASTKEGRAAALLWAKEVYNRLLAVYGTKQEKTMQAVAKVNPSLSCEVCGAPASEKHGVSKAGKPYGAIFCSTEDKSHTKWLGK